MLLAGTPSPSWRTPREVPSAGQPARRQVQSPALIQHPMVLLLQSLTLGLSQKLRISAHVVYTSDLDHHQGYAPQIGTIWCILLGC